MKNEKLARAISDIDDDLIEEAHADMLKRRGFKMRLWSSAACIAMAVFAFAVIWHRITAVNLFLMDTALTENHAVVFSESELEYLPRMMSHDAAVVIPISIEAHGSYTVSVSGGCIASGSSPDGEVTAVASADLSGDAVVEWEVDLGDNTSRYEMIIKKYNSEFILTLYFDSEKQSWTLTNERK